MRKFILGLFVTVALVCTAVADTATPAARPTPPSDVSQALGMLPGDNESAGFGVNDAGSVVGYSSAGGLSQRAFYWDRPTEVLYELTTSRLPNSIAFAIAGGPATAYAVGYEYSPAEPGSVNALIWTIVAPSPSGPITIDPITLDGEGSTASGVNDNGVAVGSRFDVDLQLPIPVIWSPNGNNSYARTDIALLPNHDRGTASDINNDGIVVGSSHPMGTTFQPRAFLRLLNGSVLELAPAQGDVRSEAEAVSDVFTNLGNGFVYVAGTTSSAGPPGRRGVRWTVNVDTGAVDQTVLSLEFATGVNDAGDVAGTSPPTRPQDRRSATLWQAGSYITLAPPKGGRESESLGLARTASSPTYVVGWTWMHGSRQAVVWEVN